MSRETLETTPGPDVSMPLKPSSRLCAAPSSFEPAAERIARLLQKEDATLIAHYYTASEIQDLAWATGGCVADSLEMARFGRQHTAGTLVIAGVRFMAETAKILSPDKRVLMAARDATCSLDIGCPPDKFSTFCDAHPNRTVVVYANTSAAVKARADWVVTSSIALEVVEYLDQQGEKILWAPDKYLGDYVQRETGADMVLWDGACVVHEEFKAEGIRQLKNVHPEAAVLVHPESPAPVTALADVTGSTARLVQAAKELPNSHFIVATDRGIFHTMRKEAPGKVFIEAPTAGSGASCQACARCPWMAMNALDSLAETLAEGSNEIQLDPVTSRLAMKPLERMVSFVSDRGARRLSA